MEATLTLADQSGVAEARRVSIQIAQSLGFSEKYQADAALVVTEAATNILKYAGRGEISLRPYREGAMDRQQGLEVVALDRGPGIANLDLAQRDGFSTGGSLGAGLGTMVRLSSQFDIYSTEGGGTALLARIAGVKMPVPAQGQRPPGYEFGARSTPKAGQIVCGDAWSVRSVQGKLGIALLDGLGHGPLASEAAVRAVGIFQDSGGGDTPADVLRRAHEGLKSTRGAVMAVALFDPSTASVSFAGVGNIVGIVVTGEVTQHLLSTDGTVGYNMRLVRESTLDWKPGSVLIATTDGLSTRWNLNRHPGLMQRHPSLIASVLHRDFARDTDDATVVVVKAR
jgi:anti-sigma regulatory factor (Ser/Thr protein kinase)